MVLSASLGHYSNPCGVSIGHRAVLRTAAFQPPNFRRVLGQHRMGDWNSRPSADFSPISPGVRIPARRGVRSANRLIRQGRVVRPLEFKRK